MTGHEYQSALTTLSLTPEQASIWLGIGRSTAYRYLKTGCEGAVARSIWLALSMLSISRIENQDNGGDWDEINEARFIARCALPPSHSDLTAAVGLPG